MIRSKHLLILSIFWGLMGGLSSWVCFLFGHGVGYIDGMVDEAAFIYRHSRGNQDL